MASLGVRQEKRGPAWRIDAVASSWREHVLGSLGDGNAVVQGTLVERFVDPLASDVEILLVDFYAHEGAASSDAGDSRGAAAHEWIDESFRFLDFVDKVTDKPNRFFMLMFPSLRFP